MKVNPRLMAHLVFAIALTLMPIVYYSIALYFGAKQDNPFYLGMLAVMLSLNCMYSFFIVKTALSKRLAYALAANLIGCFLSVMLIRVGINVENGLSGICKWLIGNAFFTVVIWELISQVTTKSIVSKVDY